MNTMGVKLAISTGKIIALLSLLVIIANAQDPDTYDFVIVGGGTAGCTLATRLSENGKHTVIVLEAGGEPHPELEIPALASRHLGDLNYVRIYETVPQKNAGLANNGKVNVTVGRTIGGGSSVNYMVFNRGSPHDFDNWANLTKDPSWGYASLLEYFKKEEDYQGQYPSDQHGSGGSITVSRPKYAPGETEWLEAGQTLGFSIADPNGPQKVSYAPVEFSKKQGRRVSAYKGYLKPVLSRTNLKLIQFAEATQIIFEENRATGVKYRMVKSDGEPKTDSVVLARKEVIISAGAIETPALLMRSGVGPKDVLEAVQIPQIKELPVGNNLQDHPLITISFILNNKSAVFDPERDLTSENLELYNTIGDGPYSSFGGLCAQSFVQSSKSKATEIPNWPDTSLYFLNSPMAVPVVPLGESEGTLSDLGESEVTTIAYVGLGRPKSRGTVRLNLENITSLPLVDFQYFTESQDMDVMVEGVKSVLNTFENTPSFQKLGARYSTRALPSCSHVEFRSDDYWKCYIGHLVSYGLHASGTCKMGSGPEDPDAVVDSQLRVIGLDRLRVVDASIMSVITNSNLQSPVYAIAEKASDMILKHWQ